MEVPTNKNLSRSNPRVIGLTGGIGAGKSLIAKVFSILGVPVFNSDDAGRNILDEDAAARESVRQIFGDRAFVDGVPDRKYLADIVFNDTEMREKLNQIIHPAVRQAFARFVNENRDADYVINEAAILIETGAYKNLDAMILVTAPEEIRIQRVMKRDGISAQEVKNRMEAQWPEEKKREYSQFIIVNDGMKPVLPAIWQTHNALKRMHAQSE